MYFVSPVSFFRKGGDDNVRRVGDPDPLDNNQDYYLYSIIEGDENINFDVDMLCLEWTEMNIHFNLMKYYIYYRIYGVILPANYKPFELTTRLGFFMKVLNLTVLIITIVSHFDSVSLLGMVKVKDQEEIC
ncbi:MAG: hypothetical protein R2764_16005 [Bacteroidales bacterium]